MNMFGSFLPSLWSSKQPQSTRVEEPTLLCNHVVLDRFESSGTHRQDSWPLVPNHLFSLTQPSGIR